MCSVPAELVEPVGHVPEELLYLRMHDGLSAGIESHHSSELLKVGSTSKTTPRNGRNR
jgi:hypothetical protein